ncbi:MAG: cystathionine gamma-synthase [Phenylobacterium sp.]|uniref:cystathionine gamma-synthase n=1 Tax=Phenylobacterium sp. TaxID=1871053 RepID=UPI0025DF7B65|nr:cystathionine gamma-synthase [Phenylobacterium sp.]MBI1197904.1 cystathionine gamma-synthase [Phenylobacterium sp.]
MRPRSAWARPQAAETIAAANGVARDAYGDIVGALHLTSTYAFKGLGREGPYAYSRAANPSRDLLSETLALLEGGAGAVITGSGMAAIDLLLGRLGPDDLVVAPHDGYWGTQRLLGARAAKRQFSVAFVDEADEHALGAALERRPALLLIETPSNPLMRVYDIAALAARAKTAGTKVVVDNTFLSPALQQPIALGADFVVHSTTKYLNGHSDVVGGAVVAAAPDEAEALAEWGATTGAIGAPFDAYLTLRGLRTLFVRMERQQRSAAALADLLAGHPAVSAVHYPGLRADPGHLVAGRQQRGFGAMLSFELHGGFAAARAFVETLRVFTLAESLGGVESLVAHPETMTHAGMDPAARASAGIHGGLLRLSVGLEAEAELVSDVEAGLSAAHAVRRSTSGAVR